MDYQKTETMQEVQAFVWGKSQVSLGWNLYKNSHSSTREGEVNNFQPCSKAFLGIEMINIKLNL
jgi:hypothetical protein